MRYLELAGICFMAVVSFLFMAQYGGWGILAWFIAALVLISSIKSGSNFTP